MERDLAGIGARAGNDAVDAHTNVCGTSSERFVPLQADCMDHGATGSRPFRGEPESMGMGSCGWPVELDARGDA